MRGEPATAALAPGGSGVRLPALEFSGLSYSFGRRPVLDCVGFRVMPGSFTVLLGLNGAGKRTLARKIQPAHTIPLAPCAALPRSPVRDRGLSPERPQVILKDAPFIRA